MLFVFMSIVGAASDWLPICYSAIGRLHDSPHKVYLCIHLFPSRDQNVPCTYLLRHYVKPLVITMVCKQ